MPTVVTWMDLEIIILSELSQTEKDKPDMIAYMQHLYKRCSTYTNAFTSQKEQSYRPSKQIYGYQRKGGKWHKLGVWE